VTDLPDDADEPTTHTAYWQALEAEDQRLDQELAKLRDDYDRGFLTVREAADMRVAALQRHLAELTRLRRELLGDDR
jgi:hypothetical protein